MADLDEDRRAQLLAIFREFDTDNSGTIQVEEVEAMLQDDSLGLAPGVTAESVMRLLDGDGDGDVTEEEFMAAMMGGDAGGDGDDAGETEGTETDESGSGSDPGMSGLSRSRKASRKNALDWVSKLQLRVDTGVSADGEPLKSPTVHDDTNSELSRQHTSDMQGDIDLHMLLDDSDNEGEGYLGEHGEEAYAALKEVDNLKSKLKIVEENLEAEVAHRKAAESSVQAITADRDALQRILDEEKVAAMREIAERDAAIAALRLQLQKTKQDQLDARTTLSDWATAQATTNQRLAALLQQHRVEMAHLTH
eukprot:CAMPEP_0182932282 /NCGR_PEP_ID=MMETSP0105_2-20130417/30917_1 /TAXON_ID=81532 ORGANISM="Acanthoeca-like sp., Strain 10tr" /NCGR_SAMPLE_ID=MMETSP0105_2 /ASSEMBLY_ACC=CAM_ASM_000205 /LENGTH=307 /DNA_ID=CAMNT_0025070847 /DNA_START=124 /DNA_END=1047 /DNA_ORIENTATION=+